MNEYEDGTKVFNDPKLFEWDYIVFNNDTDTESQVEAVYCRDLIKSFPYNSDKERADF